MICTLSKESLDCDVFDGHAHYGLHFGLGVNFDFKP